jgi:hypothetical protein
MNDKPKKKIRDGSFHIKTKSCIDKIFLFSSNGKFIGRMKNAPLDGPSEYKIFNSIPSTPITEATACLVGGEELFNYTFNNLFSQALNPESIEILKKNEEWNNMVIINTPKGMVEFVTLDFPLTWQNIWKIPKYIFLYKISLDKMKFPESTEEKPIGYLKKKFGIDPERDSFIATIALRPPEPEYLDVLDLEKLLQINIKVKCYSQYSKYHILIDEDGNTKINI